MNIYLGHSSQFDYQTGLYLPLKKSQLWKIHVIFLPHDSDPSLPQNSKKTISQADLFLAEVSYPSIGLGIELGWAETFNKKVICMHRSDKEISSSLFVLCNQWISYSSTEEMIEKIEILIDKIQGAFEA